MIIQCMILLLSCLGDDFQEHGVGFGILYHSKKRMEIDPFCMGRALIECTTANRGGQWHLESGLIGVL